MIEKTVMITGASKGLGKALAFSFADAGYRLSICARGEKELLQVRDALIGKGAEVIAIVADASKTEEVERFVSITEHAYGNIDVLINNASYLGPSPIPSLLDYSPIEFREVMRVNAEGPFLVTKRVLPGMIRRKKGSIINVTSEAGGTGYAGWGAYGISKFALEGMTETWADELSGSGVRVNMVDPGEMDTEMHEKAVPDCDYLLERPENVTNVFLHLAESNDTGVRVEAQRLKDGDGS
ncbi:SDR family NAD(P)-dependent oxidoreductase [Bacillus sp. RAR_GA_16]|uniref:SDR family NAD(P)-dependent oxidoreductase n=1 Tax=Bacillus sp. RAR_GA_16 TaxID=2876774 RepID=UPI001CCCF4C8|nr:SDR family oxidoreductase [Bacillus sp. RAR_GA_16]MCA0173775.1 SDR family oxidoreductase [Bacillus sp. RAR_GA_16]